MSRLSKDDTLCALHSIPSHLRPMYNMQYVRACRSVLSLHISNRISYLMNLSITDFFEIFFSVSLIKFNTDSSFFRMLLTEEILVNEYGELVISVLSTSTNTNAVHQNKLREVERQCITTENVSKIQQIRTSWPTVTPNDVVFQCLESYRTHTVWVPLLTCCVCGLQRKDVLEIDLEKCELDFGIVHAKDEYITHYESHLWDRSYIPSNYGVLLTVP